MKCYRRDYKPVTIRSFAELGASFPVTVSLALWPRAVWLFPPKSFSDRPFLTTAFCSSTWQHAQRENPLGFLGVWLVKQVKSSTCLHQRLPSLNANMKTSFKRLWEDRGFPKIAKVMWEKVPVLRRCREGVQLKYCCFPWDHLTAADLGPEPVHMVTYTEEVSAQGSNERTPLIEGKWLHIL